MIFLTYNDAYSGIYKSQVIDVCAFLEKEMVCPTRLVALISLRNFGEQKKLIRAACSNAIVLPMFPKVRFWKMNTLLLFFVCLFSGEKKMWARGPFACNMAIRLKKMGLLKKVIFDARGAYLAELTEYNVVVDGSVKENIKGIEQKALMESDAQLAVSAKLVEWWKDQYSFVPKKNSIIPCTLSEVFLSALPYETEIEVLRTKMGFIPKDIILVYSGSSAGWQSFSLVDDFLYSLFKQDPNIKLIFLSKEPPVNSKTFIEFSQRISTRWVAPNEVRELLLAADHGLLIREKSITNKVASPVKFAEYLSCGLQVEISPEIGDFTEFVRKNDCGSIPDSFTPEKVSYAKKVKNHNLALATLSKYADPIKKEYSRLLEE